MNSITLDLPMPPSTNNIWRRGRVGGTGRAITYLTATYKKWKEAAAVELQRQKPKTGWAQITGPFDVAITLTTKKRFKMDGDNRIKAALDWCQREGLIVDDKFLNRLELTWGDAPLGFRISLVPADVEA